MNKDALQPLSGFRDYDKPTKDWVINQLRQLFTQFGYRPLETPSIEREEMLLLNYGDEAQKLLYLFEDNGQRKVGLRYDLTVPLARYVASNWQSLALPYKRYEIGNSWRAERAQRGRLRQFTQADIDVVGTASLGAEKEMIEVIKAATERLQVPLICLINDRRVISALLAKLKIKPEAQIKLLQLLDKKDKISSEKLEEELGKLALTDVQRRQVAGYFLSGEDSLSSVGQALGDSAEVSGLEELLKWGKTIGLNIRFEPSMVRGLDYYTGTIFECVVDGYPSSLVGGGRYDSLVESLIGETIPAVGISFGVDRIVDYLDSIDSPLPEAYFVAHLPEVSESVDQWVSQLRLSGKNVELYLDPTIELGKQIKYASKKGYKSVLLPFNEEWKKGKIVVKDLETGAQKTLDRPELLNG